jgi:hypothetical protein
MTNTEIVYAAWHVAASKNNGAAKLNFTARDLRYKSKPLRHIWMESKHDVHVMHAATKSQKGIYRCAARLWLMNLAERAQFNRDFEIVAETLRSA